jgi:uncharacterized membrane protein HdeD (DUF308 family)
MDRDAKQVVGVLWWTLLIKGLIALAFGIAAVFWPGPTLIALLYLFSAYIIVTGIMNIILGIFGHRVVMNMWLAVLLLGILEIAVGVYVIRNPGISLGVLILIIGFTFLLRGIWEVVAAFMASTPDRANKTLLILSGVLSILVGIYIVMQPAAGGLAFVWALGVYAIVVGSMDIARSISAKHLLMAETV